jgi:hypothetical protein
VFRFRRPHIDLEGLVVAVLLERAVIRARRTPAVIAVFGIDCLGIFPLEEMVARERVPADVAQQRAEEEYGAEGAWGTEFLSAMGVQERRKALRMIHIDVTYVWGCVRRDPGVSSEHPAPPTSFSQDGTVGSRAASLLDGLDDHHLE